LLDVKLEIAERVRYRLGVRNSVRFEAEVLDRVAQRASRVVGPIELRHIECAGQRAAAKKGCAESDALFVRETDDLDGKGKSFLIEQLDQRDREHRPEHTVECAGIRYRVEMRADVETPRRRRKCLRNARRVHATDVSDGVHAHRHARARHPAGERRVHVAHRLRQKRSCDGVAIFRQLRQLPAPANHLAGLLERSACAHDPL
jgi:hypothetical protein